MEPEVFAAIALSAISGVFGLAQLMIGIRSRRPKESADASNARQVELNKQADLIVDGLRSMLTDQANFYKDRIAEMEKQIDEMKNDYDKRLTELRQEMTTLREENRTLKRNQP